MFKFLFGRTRPSAIYGVYYTLPGSTFTLKANIPAESSYEANRIFDRSNDGCYHRVANQTRRIL